MTKALSKLEKQLITDGFVYKIKPHPIGGGFQIIVRFPNGYGASIVRIVIADRIYGSYTHNDNEVEIAVIKFTREGLDNYTLCYDTSITDDVLGHQSFEDTLDVLKRIKEL